MVNLRRKRRGLNKKDGEEEGYLLQSGSLCLRILRSHHFRRHVEFVKPYDYNFVIN